jgi:hypothetical protein
MTVDRPTRSRTAPATVSPKGTADRMLDGDGRTADTSTYRPLTRGRALLRSPALAGGRPKRLPVVAFSRSPGVSRKQGFICMNTQARTHGQAVGVVIDVPAATMPFTENPVRGVAIHVPPAMPAPADRRPPRDGRRRAARVMAGGASRKVCPFAGRGRPGDAQSRGVTRPAALRT